eukprot:Lithocolla_globosa_v1_NODE_4099_length_1511_cov_23.146291.p3 type:complete len:104 gc:universal NODE_4099_length_1511_cov_23.146291:505-816(+)
MFYLTTTRIQMRLKLIQFWNTKVSNTREELTDSGGCEGLIPTSMFFLLGPTLEKCTCGTFLRMSQLWILLRSKFYQKSRFLPTQDIQQRGLQWIGRRPSLEGC